MDIDFKSRKLMKTFNSDKALKKGHGDRMARTIQARLAVLKNAPTLSLVPTTLPERLHLLSANRNGQYAVDLVQPHRLIFVPNHDPKPLKEDGGLDRDKVTAITIVEISDYH